jgi:hypothetical protein
MDGGLREREREITAACVRERKMAEVKRVLECER